MAVKVVDTPVKQKPRGGIHWALAENEELWLSGHAASASPPLTVRKLPLRILRHLQSPPKVSCCQDTLSVPCPPGSKLDVTTHLGCFCFLQVSKLTVSEDGIGQVDP